MGRLLGVVLFLLRFALIYGWEVWPCDNTTLGIQSGRIMDSQMNASSALPDGPAHKARLNGIGAWRAAINDVNQFLQIDLLDTFQVNGVHMQGNSEADEWVETYEIYFSVTGDVFLNYKQGLTFNGNSDRNTVVSQLFMMPPRIIGRFIRIRPLTWNNRIAMRIELAGCNKAPGVKLNCTKNAMILQVPKGLLFPLQPNELHLLGPNCTGVEVNISGIAYYEFNTALDKCKTICYTTPNFIHYYNMVSNRGHGPEDVIFRYKRVRVPFSCTYKSIKTITSIGVAPNLTVFQFGKHEFGIFPVTLSVFDSDKYNNHLAAQAPVSPGGQAGAASVALGSRIYAELEFEAGDPHLVAKAKDCWATSDSNPNSAPRFILIKNGTKVDPTLKWHPMTPKSRKRQRFSFKSFVFLKLHRYIYLHCTIVVCKLFTGFCRDRPGKREMPLNGFRQGLRSALADGGKGNQVGDRKELRRLEAEQMLKSALLHEHEIRKHKKEMGVDKLRQDFEGDHHTELVSHGPIYIRDKLREERLKENDDGKAFDGKLDFTF